MNLAGDNVNNPRGTTKIHHRVLSGQDWARTHLWIPICKIGLPSMTEELNNGSGCGWRMEDEQLQRVAMGMPHFKGCEPIGNRKRKGKLVRDLTNKKQKQKQIIQHQDPGDSHIT